MSIAPTLDQVGSEFQRWHKQTDLTSAYVLHEYCTNSGSGRFGVPEMTQTDRSGFSLCAACYTPCNRNSDLRIPMTQTHSKIFHCVSRPSTNLSTIFGTLHLDPAQPSPFHALIWLPWPRLCNPISGLLFPSPRPRPCVVPRRYKSEPPMYCKTQFEYRLSYPPKSCPVITTYYLISSTQLLSSL